MLTYPQLRGTIQDYVENHETVFAEHIDTFIVQAENRIAHLVRLPPHRKQATGSTVADAPFIVPPTDFLSPDMLFIEDAGETFELQNKEPEFIYTCYPDRSLRKRPRYYAKVDESTILLGATPDRVYNLIIGYFAYPPSITTSVTERSYLGDRCESLLLYGCLIEAYTFMKGEPELLQFYDMKFKEAVGLYKKLGDGRARKDSYEEPDAREQT